MVLKKIIRDEDLGLSSIGMPSPRIRHAARGIVLNEDGKIALFHKARKNEYKLPGGGVEEGEDPEEAFRREALEETGCEVEIVKALGTTEELKTRDNFRQISYVFVGKVLRDSGNLNLTQKEKDEGGEISWEDPKEALRLIADCYDKLIASEYESVYHTQFIVLRDKAILEYYLGLDKNASMS